MKTQVFEPAQIDYDKTLPTTPRPNHFHLILAKGMKIIGAAHLEFLDTEGAALWAIAIDTDYQQQGYGRKMLALLERWVKYQGRHYLLLHALLSTENFYRKLGYIDMEFNSPAINGDYIDLGKIL